MQPSSFEIGAHVFDEGGVLIGDKGLVAPGYQGRLDDIRDATVSPPELKWAIPITSFVIILTFLSPFIPGMPKLSIIPALIAAVGLACVMILKFQPSVITLRTSKGQVKILKGQDKSFQKRVTNTINAAKRGTNVAGTSPRRAKV